MLVTDPQGKRVRLRWRYEYAASPARYGGWDNPNIKAWNISRDGLLWAVIEAEDFEGNLMRVAECPGPDFCMFQWEAEVGYGASGPSQQRLVGLSIISRSAKLSVYNNGIVSSEKRANVDLDNHFQFGKV